VCVCESAYFYLQMPHTNANGQRVKRAALPEANNFNWTVYPIFILCHLKAPNRPKVV